MDWKKHIVAGVLALAALQAAVAQEQRSPNPKTASVEEALSEFATAFDNLDWPAFRGCFSTTATIFHPAAPNTKLIDSRSILRKSGLMCWVKVTGSSGPGRTTGCRRSCGGANAETLDPGVALQTHHQRGTGIFGGGIAPCWEFSLPMRDPHSR